MEPIRKVTITGIDSDVTHFDVDNLIVEGLVDMTSDNFIDLELAFLYSSTRNNTPRYPSPSKMKDFFQFLDTAHPYVQKAIHLCGQGLDFVVKDPAKYEDLLEYADRIQINWNWSTKKELFDKIMDFVANTEQDIIFQYNKSNELLPAFVRARLVKLNKFARNEHIHWLYDSSGGRGNDGLRFWSELPEVHRSDRIGYAGGITPDNVQSILETVCKSDQLANWIDLESGVRTDDKLDIQKCKLFLSNVLKFNDQFKKGLKNA